MTISEYSESLETAKDYPDFAKEKNYAAVLERMSRKGINKNQARSLFAKANKSAEGRDALKKANIESYGDLFMLGTKNIYDLLVYSGNVMTHDEYEEALGY